jgi:hypothetical protein
MPEAHSYHLACALQEYFPELVDNKDYDPGIGAEELVEKHRLNQEQAEFMREVSVRAGRAKAIIGYLEDRFDFDDAGGLHRLVMGGYTPKGMRATSYHIAMSFTKRIWRHKDEGLVKNRATFDQLSVPLEKTIARLEMGQVTNCAALAFYRPSTAHYRKQPKAPEDRLLETIFPSAEGAYAEQNEAVVVEHELRHIYDNILGFPIATRFSETQAHLYVDRSLEGLKRDELRVVDPCYSGIQRRKGMKEKYPYLEIDLDSYVQEQMRLIEETHEEFSGIAALLKQIPEGEYPRVSYLFSICSPDEIPEILLSTATGLANQNLRKGPGV